MDNVTFTISRSALVRYKEAYSLIVGLFIIGWLLLRVGFRDAYRQWADSLDYRMDRDAIYISGCIRLWGIVLYRYEKRIPLAKVTDVKLVQGPVLSYMNLWTLHVQTAGTGYGWPEGVMHALEKPHEARDQIMHAIAALREKNAQA